MPWRDPDAAAMLERLDQAELAGLLTAVEVFIRRYVIVDEAQATALTLWTAHTWAIEAAHATPYLFISSAEAESGKTRVMEVLHELVRTPLLTMNISDAALFRAIDKIHPTLFFDEIDSIFNPKARERGAREELRALLNAGYRRGQKAYRMGGANRTTLEPFEVFCPKGLAGLGTLPSTLASRCIPIEMKRRRLNEPVEDFFPSDFAEETAELRAKLDAWAEAHLDVLRAARPARVEGVRDRTMEVWRPLLAIAEIGGEAWSARARRAVVTLVGGASDEPSLGLLLLEDIRGVLEPEPPVGPGAPRPAPLDVIATAMLIRALALAEESPWGEWWIDPKTSEPSRSAPRRLAQLLRPFGIRPKVVRIGETTPRGYERKDFKDAWERFLPPRPVFVCPEKSATSATCATSEAPSQAVVADVADVAHFRGYTKTDEQGPGGVEARMPWECAEHGLTTVTREAYGLIFLGCGCAVAADEHEPDGQSLTATWEADE